MSAPKQTQSVLRYAGLATQWMVMLLVAVWIGHQIDKWTNWKIPVFIILLPLIALVLSFWKIINELSKPKK